MISNGKLDPQAMLNVMATLYINDAAKQRYFNPSRGLIMVTRFADAQRNLEMDQATWNQVGSNPLGNIANVVQPDGTKATVGTKPVDEDTPPAWAVKLMQKVEALESKVA